MPEEELETIQQTEIRPGSETDDHPGGKPVAPPRPSGDELSIKMVTNTKSLDAFRQQWDDLVDSTDTYFYQTFDWNRSWWEHFGDGRDLQVILLYHEDDLVGIAPLFRDTVTLFGDEVDASLRFIGSSVSQPEGEELVGLLPYSDYLDFVVRPGYEDAVFERLLPYFGQSNPDYSRIILDEIPENSPVWDHLVPLLDERGYQYELREASTCPIVRLEGDWDDYLSSLSKSSRYQARRNVKLAQKESHKVFDVYDAGEEDLLDAYDEFVRLHQQRWNHIGYPGTFAEERMYEFMRDVVRKSYEKGRISLKRAVPQDGDSSAAVDMIFRYGDRAYLMHRALDDESDYLDDSPGNVLLNVALKEAANSGKKVFDFLRGTESFKFRTAEDSVTNRTLTIQSSDSGGRLKKRLAGQYVAMRRRLKLEQRKMELFMERRTRKGGVGGYLSFLFGRIRRKFSD